MKKSTMQQAPLFNVMRPITNRWRWKATSEIASSGYTVSMHVTALSEHEGESLIGSAWCDVSQGDDPREVLEFLAIEAMLAACEPTLDGSTPQRKVVFTTSF